MTRNHKREKLPRLRKVDSPVIYERTRKKILYMWSMVSLGEAGVERKGK